MSEKISNSLEQIHSARSLRYNVEASENWKEIVKEIPFLQFDKRWKVQIVPAWGFAIARFNVQYKDKTASIYLDWYDGLGFGGELCYKIGHYPDTERFKFNEIEQLMQCIKGILK